MSRFAGLRVPSEPCSMRWRDIDWSGNRMTVHSPKTEHHLGKGERVVPIFPELRPYLDELFAAATKGFELTVNPDDWVLPSFRREAADDGDWRGVNLRTQFKKILKRAGVTPWPRLWHNLRASRQTEPHDCPANAKTLGFPRVLAKKLGDTGFEPVTSTV